jgi:branched-chain amino acid transport system permease protein
MQRSVSNTFQFILGNPSYYVAVLFLSALGLVPLFSNDPYVIDVLVLANIYAIFSGSWDILSGYTGKENFGHALFIGAGAYGAAYLNLFLGVHPLINLFLGGMIGVFFGILIGIPCLPLKGPYLALATVAAAGIAERIIMIFPRHTGGEEGLYGLSPITDGPVTDYYLSLMLLCVTIITLMGIGYSNKGLILRSIHSDEIASEAAGINTNRYKLWAFAVSSFFAGMGGAFYAHYQMYTGPTYVTMMMSINVIIMCMAGGLGTIIGPVLGAYLLTVSNEFLRSIGDLRVLVYTGLVVIIVLFLPRGIFATLFDVLPSWKRNGED